MNSAPPSSHTLAQAAAKVRAGELTATSLLQSCLNQIDTYNPKLNAFITVTREEAVAQANVLDEEARAGKFRGPLHGIPIALKDNIDTAGIRTTAASAVFDNRVPEHDAEVVRRLIAAGAIVIGKTNLHEFAMGGTSAISYFGPVRNPWALDRHPGGSSGGSAVAVATGMCLGAIGTDTGGSVRIPASHCGVTGFKATYGRVPIRGIVPLAWTLDHCGPVARTAEDCAILLQAIAGHDPLDRHSIDREADDYVGGVSQPVQALRLGVVRTPYFDHVEAELLPLLETAIATAGTLTAGVRNVRLPKIGDIGLIAETAAFHEEMLRNSANRYQLPTRRTLEAAVTGLAIEYARDLQKVLSLRNSIGAWFQKNEVDLIVVPTMRRIPLLLTEAIRRAETDLLTNPELENTGVMNVLGIPAITVPCGFTAGGFPAGLMIAGPPWAEARVLAFAHAYQQATPWTTWRPPLTPDTPVPPLGIAAAAAS